MLEDNFDKILHRWRRDLSDLWFDRIAKAVQPWLGQPNSDSDSTENEPNVAYHAVLTSDVHRSLIRTKQRSSTPEFTVESMY